MPFVWSLERSNGFVIKAAGIDGWENILSHEDVSVPGRIRWIMLEGEHPPIMVQLQDDETLVMFRRRIRTLESGGTVPDMTVLGVRRPDGCVFEVFVHDSGALVSTTHEATDGISPLATVPR